VCASSRSNEGIEIHSNVASRAAAGLAQQASMAAGQVREPLEALLPLALLVLLLTAILGLVA
jgi:hypothetical protein